MDLLLSTLSSALSSARNNSTTLWVVILICTFVIAPALAYHFLDDSTIATPTTEANSSTAFKPSTHPSSTSSSHATQEEEAVIVLRDFTLEQLADFNGVKTQQIYMSLDGDVYDVTSASHLYGPDGSYSVFAGRDVSRALAKMSFAEEDLLNCCTDDCSALELAKLNEWMGKFKYEKGYPLAGRVSTPPTGLTFTKEQLAQSKETAVIPSRRIHAPIYVCINRDVFDVSYGGCELYGPTSPYVIFTGINASRALARMSFKPEDLQSDDLSDLSDAELKVLGDWYAKFKYARKYPIVGVLV